MEKSWKINVAKEGAPCMITVAETDVSAAITTSTFRFRLIGLIFIHHPGQTRSLSLQ